MVRRSEVKQRGGQEPELRYWPVIQLATGRVVGAELVAPNPVSNPKPAHARAAARAFAFGSAAAEGWSLAVRLRPGAVSASTAPEVVGSLLGASGLVPQRLLLQVTEAEATDAVASGTAAALAALGVRFTVVDFGAGALTPTALRHAPVASVQVSLAGLDRSDGADISLLRSVVAVAAALGIEVVGKEVESDDQLTLAGDAGIALVQGYRWGSAGSLAKLVATWARQGVSG